MAKLTNSWTLTTVFGLILLQSTIRAMPHTEVTNEIRLANKQRETLNATSIATSKNDSNCLSEFKLVRPKIVIFLSSVRVGRMATRMGKFVETAVRDSGMTPIIFDPAEMIFEMLREPIHFMKSAENAPKWLREANDTISSANGFIAVSAEYNGEMPPALTNMLDHFSPAAYAKRPAAIVTYSEGLMAGIRVSAPLRQFLSILGMLPLPKHVGIPSVSKNIDQTGNCTDDKLTTRLNELVGELKDLSNALELYKKAGKIDAYY